MAFQVEHEDIEVTDLSQVAADLTQFEADFPVRLRQAVFGEQFQEPSHSAVVLPQLTDSFDVLDPPDAGRLLFQAMELLRENHPPDFGQGICRLDGWTVSQRVVRMDECMSTIQQRRHRTETRSFTGNRSSSHPLHQG